LASIGGEFYFLTTCEVVEPEEKEVGAYLGVDLGSLNLATDSDGHVDAGGQVIGIATLRPGEAQMRIRHDSSE